MPTIEELLVKFNPNNPLASLEIPKEIPAEEKLVILNLVSLLYFSQKNIERLETERVRASQKVFLPDSPSQRQDGVSMATFWSAIGGLALLILLCFIITWTTRPSVEELREATSRHSVKETLREVAPNGVISLKDASKKLGFEVIKTPNGEIYISLPKE